MSQQNNEAGINLDKHDAEPFTAAELSEIEAIALAAPKCWFGTYQIVDGISDEKAVALIEACSPDTILSLTGMACRAPAPADDRGALRKLCDQLDGMKRTMFLRPGTGQHYSYLVHEDVQAYVEQARAALAHQAAPAQPAIPAGASVRDMLRWSQADTDYHGKIVFTQAQFNHFVSMLTAAAPVQPSTASVKTWQERMRTTELTWKTGEGKAAAEYQYMTEEIADLRAALAAAPTSDQQAGAVVAAWTYCPECGSEEIRYEEGAHKQCAICHQEWWTDVDYSDVVRKHLHEWKYGAAPAAIEQAGAHTGWRRGSHGLHVPGPHSPHDYQAPCAGNVSKQSVVRGVAHHPRHDWRVDRCRLVRARPGRHRTERFRYHRY